MRKIFALTLLTASTSSYAVCDYSAADFNLGYGWDPETRMSCPPLADNGHGRDFCDFSDADQNDGFGFNHATGVSCPPMPGGGDEISYTEFYAEQQAQIAALKELPQYPIATENLNQCVERLDSLGDASSQLREFASRADIAPLPNDLCDLMVELKARPQSLEPLPILAEADDASLLFSYYLLDTSEFEDTIFTTRIEGVNDSALQTAANAANDELPTIGAIRLAFEPKEGLRGDPQSPVDPAAFVDVFTDLSGLFVINNEAGWYEGWLIRDLTVPETIAEVDSQGVNPWGTMTQADHDALVARSQAGINVPGSIFTLDGEEVRIPSKGDDFANGDIGNTVGFPISIGSFNSLQQSDAHAYWELNPGTNWTFPLYELPFTGGLDAQPSIETPSIVPPTAESLNSGNIPEEFISQERRELLGDDPLNARDPDRTEDKVNFTQTETRNRFIPSNLANEIFLDVFVRTESFAPGVGMPQRLYSAYAHQLAKVDSDGDGAVSFGEADIIGTFENGDETLTGRDLYISAVDWNRYAITREINDGILAPRFAPSQRAYVASGLLILLDEGINSSVFRDADDR